MGNEPVGAAAPPPSGDSARPGISIRRELRHVLVLSGGTASAAVLAMLYQFVVGHKLGPAEFADFATVVSLLYFFGVAAGLVNATAARFSAEFAAKQQSGRVRGLATLLMRGVARYGIVVCMVGLIVVRPVSDWLQFRSSTPLVLAVLILYPTLLVNVARGLLRGVHDFGRYNLNVVSEAALRLAVGIVLVYAFVSAASAVAAYALALAVLIPISLLQIRSTWGADESESIDSSMVRRFGLPMLLFTFSSACFLAVDMVLVKHFFESEPAGLYGGAITLARAVGLLYGPFGVMMLPLFVAEAVGGGRPHLVVLRICSYFVGAALIPIALIVLWPSQILVLTLGSAFSEAAPVLVLLAGSALFLGVSALIGNALAGLERFGFLLPYIGGLLLETVLLTIWHESLRQVALVVFTVQVATAAAMLTTLALTMKTWNPSGAALRDS